MIMKVPMLVIYLHYWVSFFSFYLLIIHIKGFKHTHKKAKNSVGPQLICTLEEKKKDLENCEVFTPRSMTQTGRGGGGGGGAEYRPGHILSTWNHLLCIIMQHMPIFIDISETYKYVIHH